MLVTITSNNDCRQGRYVGRDEDAGSGSGDRVVNGYTAQGLMLNMMVGSDTLWDDDCGRYLR